MELLDCKIVEPAGEVRAAVIWMHGLGADGHDFVPIVPELGVADLGIRFVFPHAPQIPVTINMGMVMRAWFDVIELDFKRQPDVEGVERSTNQVRALVEREREAGIPADKIVLAGFSLGGAIALHLGLRYEERLAGLLCLSTFFATGEPHREAHSEANHDIPVFQGHGVLDPMVPPERGRDVHDRLVAWGHPVEWHEYPMQHQVCMEEIEHVGTWLRARLGG